MNAKRKCVEATIWAVLLQECGELGGVDWYCQAADCSMGKAKSGDAIGRTPTDRAKKGSKKSTLVEADGGPLSVAIAGANVHDCKLLETTLDSVVVERPEHPQHLCLDNGYDHPTGNRAVTKHGYIPHIRPIGEEKLDTAGKVKYPARRWVVERTLRGLSKCRALLVG